MDATTIFVIGVLAAAALAAVGVFVVALRRGPSAPPMTGDITIDVKRREEEAAAAPSADTADQSKDETEVQAQAPLEQAGTPASDEVEEAGEAVADEVALKPQSALDDTPSEPLPDPLLERIEISKEEYAATRRKFLNRAVIGLFGGAFLGGQALAYLAFLWPKLKGGFGTKINAGSLADIRKAVGGEVTVPKFVPAAQAWVVPIDPSRIEGSQFADIPVVVGRGDGEVAIMALWQRCVHLGCRVPECVPSQGFECPCHGSRYNFHGEYEAGPAPRNLDRFEVEVNDAGELIINTGSIFQTARARNKTIIYPQGPSCI